VNAQLQCSYGWLKREEGKKEKNGWCGGGMNRGARRWGVYRGHGWGFLLKSVAHVRVPVTKLTCGGSNSGTQLRSVRSVFKNRIGTTSVEVE
jgi:hypothetical protein